MKRRSVFYCFAALAIAAFFVVAGCDGSGNGSSSSSPDDPADEEAIPEEYQLGEPASTSSSLESVAKDSPDGESLTLVLEDQTRVDIPELDQPYAAHLKRNSLSKNDAAQSIVDEMEAETVFVPTGSLRQLTVSGNDDSSELKPVITIPGEEAGTINPASINILRIGDAYIDGDLKKGLP